jgi:cardiolipin synthase
MAARKRPTLPPPLPNEQRLRPVERLVGTPAERARAKRAREERAAEARRAKDERRRGVLPAPAAPGAIPRETEEVLRRYAVAPERVTHGNELRLLRNGAEAFPSMLEAIEGARHRIDLETYIFNSDDTGWRFAEALSRKAQTGVEVNVMRDGIGCVDTDPTLFEAMEWRGVRQLEYHPPRPWRDRWGLRRRDHRKILVVDGEVGFAGGINIGDEYGPRREDKPWAGWRDTHVRVRGAGVAVLQRLFERTWRLEGGPRLRAPAPRAAAGSAPAGTVCLDVLGNSLTSRRAIRRAYVHAMRRARRSIWISNAYFVPDAGIRRELYLATERGVDVRLMLAGQSDVEPVYYATRAMLGKFLRKGMRVFEWLPSVLHAKTAVVDGVWSTVGSYNIDAVSLLNNLEINVVVYDAGFGARMESMFEQDMTECAELTGEAWARRPWLDRVVERFWFLLRGWL